MSAVAIAAPPMRTAAPTRAERRLARRLARGDEAALRALHAEHGRTVYGYLRGLVGPSEADDVFQQVMLEVWRRGAGYDPARGSVLTWVLMIARSRAIDHLRRRVPEPRDPAALPEAAIELEADDLLERWRLAALLAALPEEDRELLRLRFHEDLSQTEIAARTGIALGTVKTRMVRGLERLRERMEAEDAHDHRRELA